MTEFNILGQRRKSRFDPNLAERIEAWDRELTKKEEAERKGVKPKSSVFGEGFAGRLAELDIDSLVMGQRYCFNEWVSHWGTIHDGRVFASMRDIYSVISQMHDEQDRYANLAVQQIRRIPYIVTSTKISYAEGFSKAKITHNYGSANQSGEITIEAPDCNSSLKDVVSTNLGMRFFQALLGTGDGAETMLGKLRFMAGAEADGILVRAPLPESLAKGPDRSAWFNGGPGCTTISEINLQAYNHFSHGYSLAVRYK